MGFGKKDKRDQHHKKPHKGAKTPGHFGGKHGQVAQVREEIKGQGEVKTQVVEERFNLTVPYGLKNQIKRVFVKRNRAQDIVLGMPLSEYIRNQVLVVVFRNPQGGISGLPVTLAKKHKLQKLGFTHVTIESVPENHLDHLARPIPGDYDERHMVIRFWKPKAGHRKDGDKGGELVHEEYDELSVLEWLYENFLLDLYELPHLVSYDLLPKRDQERYAENAIVAQSQILFGRSAVRPHQESSFHLVRLAKRLRQLFEEGEALFRFANSVAARRVLESDKTLKLPEQSFYISAELGLAYSIYNLLGCQFVCRIRLSDRMIEVEPLRTDMDSKAQMAFYHNFLTNVSFREVDWDIFEIVTSGIGTAVCPSQSQS